MSDYLIIKRDTSCLIVPVTIINYHFLDNLDDIKSGFHTPFENEKETSFSLTVDALPSIQLI